MKIKECLNEIVSISKFYRIDKPLIVGGLPRDVFLKKQIKTNDVDLTTNSSDVLRLGLLAADRFTCPFNMADDSHVTLFFENFDVDFSSNFISPYVEEFLSGKSEELYEAYSRDFTINTLHMDPQTMEILDLTGMAKSDLQNKIIRTPMPPEFTLVDDPKRVFRGIDFATRYGFDFAPELVSYIKNNVEKVMASNKEAFITQRINKSILSNPQQTLQILLNTGLFYSIPLAGEFKTLLIKEKLLNQYLQGFK